jgi:hypothetical protein
MLRYPDPIDASGSASAQQKSGGGPSGWLDEARNLAVNSEASTDLYDLEAVEEGCVLYSKSVYESCSTHVSAYVKIGFGTKGSYPRTRQARTVKDVSLSDSNISHDLNNVADRAR